MTYPGRAKEHLVANLGDGLVLCGLTRKEAGVRVGAGFCTAAIVLGPFSVNFNLCEICRKRAIFVCIANTKL
jgi:hypothetical protein